jgi:ribosome biogenesis ATPase
LAQLTDSYTGADLAGLVRQAALQSLKDSITQTDANEIVVDDDLKVNKNHFTKALRNLRPSVSKEVRFGQFVIR